MLFNIYALLTIVLGTAVLANGAIFAGFATIIWPILCLFAGAGITGSLITGIRGQQRRGFVAAVMFAAIGVTIVYQFGPSLRLFGRTFTGMAWCAAGLLAGAISTGRQVES